MSDINFTPIVLDVENVHKEYSTTPPVHALRGVSFQVSQGELVSVVGPSGSGKSTLLHLMGTLDRPTSGEITVAGHRVSDLSDRELSALRAHHIGFVFQQFHLLGSLTTLNNVAEGLLYTGRSLNERQELAEIALRRVGMGHRLDQVSIKLSGGEMQRVATARALVGDPSIVLADEPTGNLDSKNSDAIIELIEELSDTGTTIVVITHNMEIAESFPRVIGLRDGQIEYDQVMQEVT
ncbi:MAG: ABC transporter ATP-binding protein [Deltaproteobacteria bacterium]|nr:ABC transporter ATP-binding protein [Deltaproteobacteria bacterium]